MKDSKLSPDSWVAEHIAALPKSGIRDFFDIVSTMEDVISLGIGDQPTKPLVLGDAAS